MKQAMIWLFVLQSVSLAQAEGMKEVTEQIRKTMEQKQANTGLNVDLKFVVAVEERGQFQTLSLDELNFNTDLSVESETSIYNCITSQYDEVLLLSQLRPSLLGNRVEIHVYLGTYMVLNNLRTWSFKNSSKDNLIEPSYRLASLKNLPSYFVLDKGEEKFSTDDSELRLYSFIQDLYSSGQDLSSLRVRFQTWAGEDCVTSKAQPIQNIFDLMKAKWDSEVKAGLQKNSELELAKKKLLERKPIRPPTVGRSR